MPPGLALLLAVALGADLRIEPAVRTEALARRIDPAPTPAEKDAVDVTVNPSLNATVTGGLGSGSLLYNPTFTAADVGPDLRWEHMHLGEARVRLGTRPSWNLQAFANGGIGRTDFITQNRNAATGGGGTGGTGGPGGTGTGGTGGTGPATITTVNTIDLLQWRTGVALQLAPTRRTTLTLAGAVSEDGGATARSRAVQPTARGEDAAAELTWRASRLDQLGLRANATRVRIAALRVDGEYGTALATWRRNLSPDIVLSTGAGATAFRSRVPKDALQPETGRETRRLYAPAGELGIARIPHPPPVAEPQRPASTTRAEGEPMTPAEEAEAQAEGQALAARRRPATGDVTWDLLARMAGSVDRTSGVATPSLDVAANLRWPFSGATALLGNASGSLIWPEHLGRTRRGQLQLAGSFTLGPRATADLGGYGAWQRSDDPTVPKVTEYGAFVRLQLRARPITY